MNVAIVCNEQKDRDYEVTEKLIRKLDELKMGICTDVAALHTFCSSVDVCSTEEAFERADVILTVGGDGTILKAAQLASALDKPILGINMGRVGFMAEIEPHELGLLDRLLSGDYIIEQRMMLQVYIERDGEACYRVDALNDAVISHGAISRMIDITIYNKNEFITEYCADGVIFSTPTGSTAYSVAAGGPVVDPLLKTILSTPICAYSLTTKPILFHSSADLTVRLNNVGAVPYLTADGSVNHKLQETDVIHIKKSERTTKLIKFKDVSFYDILAKKLK